MKPMRKLVFLLLFTIRFWAQDIQPEVLPSPMIAVDSLYREDQFYLGFTYNILLNMPGGVNQNKFSPGFKGGFLRDFPINKRRNVAIAPGLGVTYSNYFQSLFITRVNGEPYYSTKTIGSAYQKNKFEELFIDVPIEFRWRTSQPVGHKFWRVYSGMQFSYMVYNKSVYIDDQVAVRIHNNPDFRKWQVGLYMAAGNNSWNLYAYYGLLPIFKDGIEVEGETINLHTMNLGLMFYIL